MDVSSSIEMSTPGDGWSTLVEKGAVETTPLAASTMKKVDPPKKRTLLSKAGRLQPLNQSTNVLLAYRLDALSAMSTSNFVLAVICLFFCGLNIALVYFNYRLNRGDASEDDPSLCPITDKTFHLTEFWATFIFAIVEAFALVCTPKSLLNIYENPLVLKLVLFFNIVATLVPAMMVTINLELYEIISHELEYINEITMSFVDLVLLWSLCRRIGQDEVSTGPKLSSGFQSQDEPGVGGSDVRTSFVLAAVAAAVAVVQLGVYNGMGRTEDGDMVGEAAAHYLEFIFSIISSLITFWFTMDNKFIADKEIGQILYGNHQDCRLCADQSIQYIRSYSGQSTPQIYMQAGN